MSAVLALTKGPARLLRESPTGGTRVDEEGGLYITVEQLTRFGGGDAKRGRRDLRSFLAVDQTGAVPVAPMARPLNVRLGTEADETAIMALLIQDLRENAETIAPVDEPTVLEVIQVGTRRRGGFAGIIDGPDGAPIAVTILHPCKWWWSRGWYFGEVVNYVHPDHRRSHHIDDLINFGRWVVDEQSKGLGYRVYLMCGVLGLHRFWAKTAMYRRKFRQVGSAFLYPGPMSS